MLCPAKREMLDLPRGGNVFKNYGVRIVRNALSSWGRIVTFRSAKGRSFRGAKGDYGIQANQGLTDSFSSFFDSSSF